MNAKGTVDVVTVGKVAIETVEFWYLQAQAAFASAKQMREELSRNRELLSAAGRTNEGLVEQIEKLKADLQESLLKSYNYELEIHRLKKKVNRLIRKGKTK